MGRRQDLEAAIAEYRLHPMLGELRRESQGVLVPPSGPLEAPIVLCGEAPGEDEILQDAPFVGRAGQHLRYLLKRAGINPSVLYITNVVLYRPLGNRTPYPYEYLASRPRLMRELAIVKPLVVVSLGATAYFTLSYDGGLPYSQARGKWLPLRYSQECPPADLLVTWHPSAALRDRIADDELAAHLKLIMRNGDDSSDRRQASTAGATGA